MAVAGPSRFRRADGVRLKMTTGRGAPESLVYSERRRRPCYWMRIGGSVAGLKEIPISKFATLITCVPAPDVFARCVFFSRK